MVFIIVILKPFVFTGPSRRIRRDFMRFSAHPFGEFLW
jgi:hypothetical protein